MHGLSTATGRPWRSRIRPRVVSTIDERRMTSPARSRQYSRPNTCNCIARPTKTSVMKNNTTRNILRRRSNMAVTSLSDLDLSTGRLERERALGPVEQPDRYGREDRGVKRGGEQRRNVRARSVDQAVNEQHGAGEEPADQRQREVRERVRAVDDLLRADDEHPDQP